MKRIAIAFSDGELLKLNQERGSQSLYAFIKERALSSLSTNELTLSSHKSAELTSKILSSQDKIELTKKKLKDLPKEVLDLPKRVKLEDLVYKFCRKCVGKRLVEEGKCAVCGGTNFLEEAE